MRHVIFICVLSAWAGSSPAAAEGTLRIFGGSATGDFYLGGGGASFGLDLSSSDRALYAGVHFTFHNGSQDKVLPDGISMGTDVIGDASQSQVGGEIGVSIRAHPWVVRPTMGGGISRLTLDSATVVLTSEIRSVLHGSVTIGRMITETALIGAEIRVMWVGDLGNSVAGYLTLGTTFGN